MNASLKTILVLLAAVVVGTAGGFLLPPPAMKAVLLVKQLSGQIVFFLVPLIILGFVAPSIASLRGRVSQYICVAFLLAYVSSIGAAFFALLVSRTTIPLLRIQPADEPVRALPELLFSLQIPPVLPVMSALLLAVLLGLGTYWIASDRMTSLLLCFRDMVLQWVRRVLIPVLPWFVAANFCILSCQGAASQLLVFLPVIVLVIVCHYVWLLLLYGVASGYARRNGWQVLRHYGPAYVTALGTMSSAATLGVALSCAHRAPLDKQTVDFSVPLFANIHLCGSVLTEVFFVCVVSQLLYGRLPDAATLVVFILLLGVFAVGAPGVPGGTVLASLGIVVSVLGFDEAGTGLLITIFALQDSFGTACNVTGDGALTLIMDAYKRRTARRAGEASAA